MQPFGTDNSAGEVHRPDVTLATYFCFEPFTQGVDRCNSYAVQTTGPCLVSTGSVEFATSVYLRENDFESRAVVHICHRTDRNPPPVVPAGDRTVGIDLHRDCRRMLVDGFVDAVVDDLVHQVMQSATCGVADVHCWPRSDALNSFEGADLTFAIFVGRCRSRLSVCAHKIFNSVHGKGPVVRDTGPLSACCL